MKNYEEFGRKIWDTLKERCSYGEMNETDNDNMEIALSCGLCHRVKYDSKIHGENIAHNSGVNDGDEIFWWGK